MSDHVTCHHLSMPVLYASYSLIRLCMDILQDLLFTQEGATTL